MLFALVALPEETDISIPKLDQLRTIDMGSSRLPWIGIFRSDGSALLGYGALAGDSANVPEASFQFEEIYNLLVPHLKPDFNDDVDRMGVGLYTGSSGKGFYLEDKEIMRKIMHGLCDKVLASPNPFVDEARFRGFLREHPLVPGDPPYLKADEEADKGEVKGNRLEVKGEEGEVIGMETETPVAATKAGRPSLLFYAGIGVLACVGAALFLTRKR